MEALLKQILEDCRQYTEQGEVATYIPELAKADKRDFGICIVNEKNECFARVTLKSASPCKASSSL